MNLERRNNNSTLRKGKKEDRIIYAFFSKNGILLTTYCILYLYKYIKERFNIQQR